MTENQRLKFFRESLGYNQKQFAERLQMQPGSLSDVERGKVGVSPKLKKILYLSFLCNTHWLETGEGDMQHYSNVSEEDKWVAVFVADSLKYFDIKKIAEISGNTLWQLDACINNEDISFLSNLRSIIEYVTHADNYPTSQDGMYPEPLAPRATSKEDRYVDEGLVRELRILINEKDKRIADKETIIRDKEEIINLLKEKLAIKSSEQSNQGSNIGTV